MPDDYDESIDPGSNWKVVGMKVTLPAVAFAAMMTILGYALVVNHEDLTVLTTALEEVLENFMILSSGAIAGVVGNRVLRRGGD